MVTLDYSRKSGQRTSLSDTSLGLHLPTDNGYECNVINYL